MPAALSLLQCKWTTFEDFVACKPCPETAFKPYGRHNIWSNNCKARQWYEISLLGGKKINLKIVYSIKIKYLYAHVTVYIALWH